MITCRKNQKSHTEEEGAPGTGPSPIGHSNIKAGHNVSKTQDGDLGSCELRYNLVSAINDM